MREIKLTQGKFAQVDDSDYDWLNQWKWHLVGNYAYHCFWFNGKKITVSMHEMIMGNLGGLITDHIDRCGTNNQRHNLRPVTISQNAMNRVSYVDSSSKHKGVSWCEFEKSWKAAIMKDGLKFRKRFKTEIEAAYQYDVWCIELHGEYSRINFPEISYQEKLGILNKSIIFTDSQNQKHGTAI